MPQISHSPELVRFFAKFNPSEVLTLPEIQFCHGKIIFCCYIGIVCQNQGIRETRF